MRINTYLYIDLYVLTYITYIHPCVDIFSIYVYLYSSNHSGLLLSTYTTDIVVQAVVMSADGRVVFTVYQDQGYATVFKQSTGDIVQICHSNNKVP